MVDEHLFNSGSLPLALRAVRVVVSKSRISSDGVSTRSDMLGRRRAAGICYARRVMRCTDKRRRCPNASSWACRNGCLWYSARLAWHVGLRWQPLHSCPMVSIEQPPQCHVDTRKDAEMAATIWLAPKDDMVAALDLLTRGARCNSSRQNDVMWVVVSRCALYLPTQQVSPFRGIAFGAEPRPRGISLI